MFTLLDHNYDVPAGTENYVHENFLKEACFDDKDGIISFIRTFSKLAIIIHEKRT